MVEFYGIWALWGITFFVAPLNLGFAAGSELQCGARSVGSAMDAWRCPFFIFVSSLERLASPNLGIE